MLHWRQKTSETTRSLRCCDSRLRNIKLGLFVEYFYLPNLILVISTYFGHYLVGDQNLACHLGLITFGKILRQKMGDKINDQNFSNFLSVCLVGQV